MCEGAQKCVPSVVIGRLSSDPRRIPHDTTRGEASAPQEGKPLPQGMDGRDGDTDGAW